jgi:predicted nucleotidyltransferase
MELDGELAAVVRYLDERWGVAAAWLFGSQTRAPRPDSDIDVAVLFRTPVSPLDLLEARADLERAAGKAVDVVDLEAASPVLAYQVVKNGRLIADRDRRRRVDFVARVPSRYEDIKIIRREAEQTMLRRIAHGRT